MPENSPTKASRLNSTASDVPDRDPATVSKVPSSQGEVSEGLHVQPFAEARGECCCPTYHMCLGDLGKRDFELLADKLERVELAYERLIDPTLFNCEEMEWVTAYVTCATVERKCDELLHRALG